MPYKTSRVEEVKDSPEEEEDPFNTDEHRCRIYRKFRSTFLMPSVLLSFLSEHSVAQHRKQKPVTKLGGKRARQSESDAAPSEDGGKFLLHTTNQRILSNLSDDEKEPAMEESPKKKRNISKSAAFKKALSARRLKSPSRSPSPQPSPSPKKKTTTKGTLGYILKPHSEMLNTLQPHLQRPRARKRSPL